MTVDVPPVPDPVERLLVIRQSALGDIINALYALGAIRKACPAARVGWVVDDRFRDLFDAVDGVDELIVFPRRRWGPWLSRPWRWPQLLVEWQRYKRDLQALHYDRVVDLQGNLKSRLTLKQVKPGRDPSVPVQPATDGEGRSGPPSPDGIAPDASHRLRAAQFMRRVAHAGVRTCPAPFPWRVRPDAIQAVEDYLGREGVQPGTTAVIHPGSSAFGHYKRWPVDRFAELARRLSQSGQPVIVVWGPGERDLAARVVEAAGRGGAGVRLAPETRSLPVLVALLARAGVFVGNDSGPLHIASACGTPTVGLYGPKDPTVYAPYSPPRAVLYHPLPCSPCGKRRCSNPECMKALTVDVVYEATRTLLRDRTDKPFTGIPLRTDPRQASAVTRERVAVDARPPGRGPFRRFTAGRWRWKVVAGEEGPLADAAMRSRDGLPGDVVQRNPRRTFLRVRLPRLVPGGGAGEAREGQGAFVKVFPLVAAGHRFRAWLGRSQADVEFARLCRLRAVGAPVPAPLALGQGPGAQALVLEDLGEAPSVRSLLAGGMDAAGRRLLLAKVGDAVSALHAARFVHEDLHAGNILVLEDGSVRIVDLQRGRWSGMQSWVDRSISLAHLFLSLSPFVDAQEQFRVFRQYARHSRLDRYSARSLAYGVISDLNQLRQRHVLGQVRRANEGGSRVWIGPWQGGQARAANGAREWLDAPETVEAVIKDEAGRRVLKIRKGGHLLAIKEEGRRSRGVNAWPGAHGWVAAGLPTPRPYFLLDPPGGPVRLATEWVEGGVSSDIWIEGRLQGGAGAAWRREAARALGRLVRRIHDRGVYHADLKAGNVLARELADGRLDFQVLDLDRVVFGDRPVVRAKALANLAQLNAVFAPPVTRTDRLRCFFAYASRSAALRREWKEAVREIMRLTILRRHRWP